RRWSLASAPIRFRSPAPPRPDRVAVRLGGAGDRNRIGAEARDHRRVERVGDAWFLPEEEGTAALIQAFLPDGDDPVDVRLRLRTKRFVGILLDDFHRAVVAQVR